MHEHVAATTPSSRPKDPAELASYARSLDCIHCGLCLNTCPTYRISGSEASSPRGRIHLMRAVAEERLEPDVAFAEEMDFCLVCRHCESVCPAGVEFGALMEFTRDTWMGPGKASARGSLAGFGLRTGLGVLSRRWALRLVAGGLGLAQRLGLVRLVAPLLGERGRALRFLPSVPSKSERGSLPGVTPARNETVERASILEGCAMPELFGRVNRATANSLAAVGVEVHCPTDHTCCGALHAHNGDLEGSRQLARATIESFERVSDDQPVVVNSAGCGAHMREYGRLFEDDDQWHARAKAFAARVVDYSVYLTRPERMARLRQALETSTRPEPEKLTYDDPCHLCHGQQVRDEPRQLLEALPDVQLLPLEDSESCCGSAGIYSILRPGDSYEVLQPKLDALRRSGAEVLVTANPGCHLQWAAGIARSEQDVQVRHLAEVLAERL